MSTAVEERFAANGRYLRREHCHAPASGCCHPRRHFAELVAHANQTLLSLLCPRRALTASRSGSALLSPRTFLARSCARFHIITVSFAHPLRGALDKDVLTGFLVNVAIRFESTAPGLAAICGLTTSRERTPQYFKTRMKMCICCFTGASTR